MTRRRVATLLALAALLVALSLPLLAQAVDLEGFEGDAELDQQTFTGDSDQSGFEPPAGATEARRRHAVARQH